MCCRKKKEEKKLFGVLFGFCDRKFWKKLIEIASAVYRVESSTQSSLLCGSLAGPISPPPNTHPPHPRTPDLRLTSIFVWLRIFTPQLGLWSLPTHTRLQIYCHGSHYIKYGKPVQSGRRCQLTLTRLGRCATQEQTSQFYLTPKPTRDGSYWNACTGAWWNMIPLLLLMDACIERSCINGALRWHFDLIWM